MLLATAAMGATFMAATPAQAHNGDMYLSGSRGYGGWNSSHTEVWACDTRADGWGVRTWYRTSNGVIDHVGDANGSAGGCGRESAAGGGTIVEAQVCTGRNGMDENCTGPFRPV
jgi:hypothetical protein